MKRCVGNVVVHFYGVMNLTELKEKCKAKNLPHLELKLDQVVRLLPHDFGTVKESPYPATTYDTPENTNPPADPTLEMT